MAGSGVSENQLDYTMRHVCIQVARFAQTEMGYNQVLNNGLQIGESRNDSLALLQQTKCAQRIKFSIGQVYDLDIVVNAIENGYILNTLQLNGILQTLQNAQKLQQQIEHDLQQHLDELTDDQKSNVESIYDIAQGLNEGLPDVIFNIQHSVNNLNQINDDASDNLLNLTNRQRQKSEEIRKYITQLATDLFKQNASAFKSPIIRRDRVCVGIKVGKQGLLPKGSLVHEKSSSGSTMYMEPKNVIDANNEEAMLRGQIQEEKELIMFALTQQIKEYSQDLRQIRSTLVELDVIGAKARYANWCNGVQPDFNNDITQSENKEQNGQDGQLGYKQHNEDQDYIIYIPYLQHPLLLEQWLGKQPFLFLLNDDSFQNQLIKDIYVNKPEAEEDLQNFFDEDDNEQQENQQENQVTQQNDQPISVEEQMKESRIKFHVSTQEELQQKNVNQVNQNLQYQGNKPQYIDMRVPKNAKSVVVTGPNTGGKTVSMKALGLAALMAKAGLFIPCDKQYIEQIQKISNNVQSQDLSKSNGDIDQRKKQIDYQKIYLPWFEKILVDIGDGQDMQQSLSTFGAHIFKIQKILEVVNDSSLVLLDEVGSGTDPEEGAPLAEIILKILSLKAQLTIATTHHARIKEMSQKYPETIVNTCVEFDVETLRPTYKLIWGQVGLSNAIAIAQRIGLDQGILKEARDILKQRPSDQDQNQLENTQKVTLQGLHEQINQTSKAFDRQKQLRDKLAYEIDRLTQISNRYRKHYDHLDEQVKGSGKEVSLVRNGFRNILVQFETGKIDKQQALQQADELIKDIKDVEVPEDLAASSFERMMRQAQKSHEDSKKLTLKVK